MNPGRRLLLSMCCATLAGACATVRGLTGSPGGATSRGMWVWSSADLLGRPETWNGLFDFSRRHRITSLWMQVTTARAGGESAGAFRLEVSRAAGWRAFIAAAHGRGLRVEALDGDPTYADAAFHYVPLAIADAVLAFNEASAPGMRFDGLHFDNEPYLLPGWHDPESREQLLRDYLVLNDEVQRRVAAARPMTYGVDMPFWWSVAGDASGEAVAAVTYDGIRQSAAAHTLRRVDSVTVMDYRNTTSGPDGLVALASPLLADAARARHAEVRVGVETRRFSQAAVWFVAGPPAAESRGMLGRTWRQRYPGDPFRLQSIHDGERIHLGVTIPAEDIGGAAPPDLVRIARDFGSALAEPAAGLPAAALAQSGEWADVRPAPIADPDTGRRYSGFLATNVPQAKLTFATRPGAFQQETSAADRAFRQFASYRGMAFHDYDGLRALTSAR